jgi:hypothetical protein
MDAMVILLFQREFQGRAGVRKSVNGKNRKNVRIRIAVDVLSGQ